MLPSSKQARPDLPPASLPPGPQDLPYCCALKKAAGVFDALCPQPEVCKYPCANSCIHSLPT